MTDLITNSSSESFIIYSREGIRDFKEIISTLIGEDFDDCFVIDIIVDDYVLDYYEDSGTDQDFDDWCFEHDATEYDGSPYIEGLQIIPKNPKYAAQAEALRKIYQIFDIQERAC